ncbi:MAG: hypothetical protein HY782_12540 [Chloroflexi bacterium]|nr:hypothetical protein [Chloroflexota bacterium]
MAQPARPAHAQTPTAANGKMDGQLVEGTKDAKLANTAGMTVTLHSAPAGATSTISQTTQADANGRFSFSNLDTISTTRYLLIANYQGVDYFSDVLAFDQVQTTLPVSMTVYETTTDPAAIQVTQAHFVIDVQTGLLDVLQILAVQNNGDRTYIGATSLAGPHRVTLSLPFLAGALNIQFDNPTADDATIRGPEVMSYTLPLTPGADQIVYNYQLPFTPPTYNFNLKLPFNVDKFRVLLADVGGTIQSAQLSAPAPFPTQSGQKFILSSADNLQAGTVVSASFVNLPATVATTPPAGGSPTAPAPASGNNMQLVGGVVLGVAAVAALALLLYPVIRRRRAAAMIAQPAANRRMDLLQEIADLDDEFEEKKISEEEYKAERARLKAELLELSQSEEE